MTKKQIVNEGGIIGFQNHSEKISAEEFKLIKKEIMKKFKGNSSRAFRGALLRMGVSF